ncbi:MAG: hypothetical protein ABEJ87_01020 [Candidatus Nanohalobium sp.]
MSYFDFDVDIDSRPEFSESDGENYEGTKAGWSSQTLQATEKHDSYAIIAEYRDWAGNDINTRRDRGFLIGVTEDGDIHRWEKGETGPDYGKLLVDSSDPEKALEKGDYEWAEVADRPSLHQGYEGGNPREVAEAYLEKKVSVDVDKLFD